MRAAGPGPQGGADASLKNFDEATAIELVEPTHDELLRLLRGAEAAEAA